jgi:hypothetical protein
MDDAERFRLLGEYRTPRFRYGRKVVCQVRGEVTICGITDTPIPWPLGKALSLWLEATDDRNQRERRAKTRRSQLRTVRPPTTSSRAISGPVWPSARHSNADRRLASR